ncbi:MAG: aminopeptidase [Clostridia bacterium]
MKDLRNEKLADILINYSCRIQKGEKVLICVYETDNDLALKLIRKAYEAGGLPFIQVTGERLSAEISRSVTEEQLTIMNDRDLAFMKQMNAYISIRSSRNIYESKKVPGEKTSLISRILKPSFDQRVNHTKWCVLRYPNESMAQLGGMDTETFTDFYYRVCTLDYAKMSKAMDSLVTLMNKTDKVHLLGKGTDLTFSIKDIPAIKCAGEMNIPDGEVFTAPVRNSINGILTYNTPTVSRGKTFENVCLKFKEGKITEATANFTDELNSILDTDEGARYVGEFAIGVNPYILDPMKDTLFDEKICGSFHFTPGACYEEAPNGNDSAIHWDMVNIQTPAYGGGEIWFDDVLIRKDGIFVLDELKCLNPENLK